MTRDFHSDHIDQRKSWLDFISREGEVKFYQDLGDGGGPETLGNSTKDDQTLIPRDVGDRMHFRF